MLNRIPVPIIPVVNDLVTYTTCVGGNRINEIYCISSGRTESGKNVPPNRNIGIINKKVARTR